MKSLIVFLYFFVCILLAGMRSAHAYIDPSSMTYIIQIIAGAAIAIGAGVGFYWKRIARWFRSRHRRDHDAGNPNESMPSSAEDEVYDPTVVVNDKPAERQE